MVWLAGPESYSESRKTGKHTDSLSRATPVLLQPLKGTELDPMCFLQQRLAQRQDTWNCPGSWRFTAQAEEGKGDSTLPGQEGELNVSLFGGLGGGPCYERESHAKRQPPKQPTPPRGQETHEEATALDLDHNQ